MNEDTATMTMLAPELLVFAAAFSLFGIASLIFSIRQQSAAAFLSFVSLMLCAIAKLTNFSILAFIPMQCLNSQCNPTELNQKILNFASLVEPYLFLAAAICTIVYIAKKQRHEPCANA